MAFSSPNIALVYILICWMAFIVAFLIRKRPGHKPPVKRDSRARKGIILEAIGYGIIWALKRNPRVFLFQSVVIGTIMNVGAILLATASALLVLWALRSLDRQWAVAAQIMEDHKLITTGPYAHVRNPIYAGMFGMLIATGLVISSWYALVIGSLVFWYGTMSRIGIEEGLLSEEFGRRFDDYKNSVPALIPTLKSQYTH